MTLFKYIEQYTLFYIKNNTTMTFFEINIFWFEIQASYYGLMYALWFLAWYYILLKRWVIDKKRLDDLFIYVFLWVLLWGRLGYVLFYNLWNYIKNPLDIIKFWEWGMSFHGWVIWVVLAMVVFSKVKKFNFYKLADEVTLVLPIGIGLGRIWNYLNQELLWFSPYTWPFAVIKDGVWYFPSTLLEAFLEWVILLWVLLYFRYKKNLSDWQIASLFLIFYALFRIFVEIFFRTPDAHIWYIFWFLTMGEILTFPMFVIGVFYYYKLKK